MTGDAPSEDMGGVEATEPEVGSEHQEDFVHEKVDLPEWIPVAFGLILVAIAATAIWLA